MKIELSVEELKDIQTALVSQEKMLHSDEVLFKKIGSALDGGGIKLHPRCAKHNQVLEIYSSYESSGKEIVDIVPCPQCVK